MAIDSTRRSCGARKPFISICLVLLLVLVGRGAWADTAPSAASLYAQGIRHERTKDYVLAVHEFKAALKLDPDYSQAYGQLGNCYYYLGHKDWALTVYDRYLKTHPKDLAIKKTADSIRAQQAGSAAAISSTADAVPEPLSGTPDASSVSQTAIPVPVSGTGLAQASDQQMNAIADQMLATLQGPAATPVPGAESAPSPLQTPVPPAPEKMRRLAFGLGGLGGTYSMSNWNSFLNGDKASAGEDYEYQGSAVDGGVGLRGDVRYSFSDSFSGGFFMEYWGGGGSFTTWRTDSSGSFDATGLYSLPFLFLGPQASYTFYRSKKYFKLGGTLGLGYATLLGAYLNYTTYTVTPAGTSEIPVQSSLSDGGFAAQLSLDADYALTPGYTLTGKLGYRSAAMGKISGLGPYFQNEEASTGLDFSGFFLGLGIAYWP
ncbi:MAG TPA: tetratricopeptide repeat protein [bacterium]|jgi:hypothetical protein|nr:tetratricopeptide repeat protein [bacterium]